MDLLTITQKLLKNYSTGLIFEERLIGPFFQVILKNIHAPPPPPPQ